MRNAGKTPSTATRLIYSQSFQRTTEHESFLRFTATLAATISDQNISTQQNSKIETQTPTRKSDRLKTSH